MGVSDLFNGIAVVIDDEIGVDGKNINNLIDQIAGRKMPCISYKSLPDDDSICHFEGVSFILLDWELQSEDLSVPIQDRPTLPATLSEFNINENIEFLKKLKELFFMPIFIFTNLNTDGIIEKLKENGLYQDDQPNLIFVRRKSDLTGSVRLFREIESWIVKVPSIYVLKEWDREYRRAKNRLFSDFYALNHSWPKILWKSYVEDGCNMSQELGEIITKNLHTRMTPFSFDESTLTKRGKRIPKNEIRKVLEGERFVKTLNENDIATGDVFKVANPGSNGVIVQTYYINIRAQCDLVRSRNPHLYCLKGKAIDERLINRKGGTEFNCINGEFTEKKYTAIVPFIDDGNIIEFDFTDLLRKTWNEMKTNRIGRLLPPYITSIQQRYSHYLHRQGLPRTPKDAMKD